MVSPRTARRAAPSPQAHSRFIAALEVDEAAAKALLAAIGRAADQADAALAADSIEATA